MNLIILGNSSFAINVANNSVSDLYNSVRNCRNQNENFTLSYGGKLLDQSRNLSDYGIRDNSFITLNEPLLGGNITSFPDVGHLLVIFSVAMVMLLFIVLFFYTIVGEIGRPLKDCFTGSWLFSSIVNNPILFVIFWIILCFYASLVVSILTLYSYTYWCSDFQITASPIITAGIISIALAAGVIAYYYIANNEVGLVKRLFGNYGDKMKQLSLLIFTIALAVVSIYFVIHLILTSINKNILWFPASVVIAGLLFYFFIMRDYPLSIKIFLGIIILLIPFGAYSYAYVINSANKCV